MATNGGKTIIVSLADYEAALLRLSGQVPTASQIAQTNGVYGYDNMPEMRLTAKQAEDLGLTW